MALGKFFDNLFGDQSKRINQGFEDQAHYISAAREGYEKRTEPALQNLVGTYDDLAESAGGVAGLQAYRNAMGFGTPEQQAAELARFQGNPFLNVDPTLEARLDEENRRRFGMNSGRGQAAFADASMRRRDERNNAYLNRIMNFGQGVGNMRLAGAQTNYDGQRDLGANYANSQMALAGASNNLLANRASVNNNRNALIGTVVKAVGGTMWGGGPGGGGGQDGGKTPGGGSPGDGGSNALANLSKMFMMG
jgi:hypothetical protein